jgi:hypothetical protein
MYILGRFFKLCRGKGKGEMMVWWNSSLCRREEGNFLHTTPSCWVFPPQGQWHPSKILNCCFLWVVHTFPVTQKEFNKNFQTVLVIKKIIKNHIFHKCTSWASHSYSGRIINILHFIVNTSKKHTHHFCFC